MLLVRVGAMLPVGTNSAKGKACQAQQAQQGRRAGPPLVPLSVFTPPVGGGAARVLHQVDLEEPLRLPQPPLRRRPQPCSLAGPEGLESATREQAVRRRLGLYMPYAAIQTMELGRARKHSRGASTRGDWCAATKPLRLL